MTLAKFAMPGFFLSAISFSCIQKKPEASTTSFSASAVLFLGDRAKLLAEGVEASVAEHRRQRYGERS